MKKVLFFLFLLLNMFQQSALKAQCTAVSVITQPTDQNDSIPGHAHFSITVAGTSPYNYYWYVNGTVVDSTINSASATNTYNTPPLAMADSNNTYYCVVTNCAGANTITSNTVHLLCIPVTISIQPLSQTFTAGNVVTISFSVTVNGTPPFTYQWYRNTNTLVKTTTDTIGHTSIYSFYANPVVYGMNGNTYHVVITNCRYGPLVGNCSQVTSNNALLTVGCPTMSAPTISGPWSGVCSQLPFALSTGTVAGASYLWSGPNGFTSTLQNPTTNIWIPGCEQYFTYSVSITVNGCTSLPGMTTVDIYAAPYVINPPANQTICSGETFSYIPLVDCSGQIVQHSYSYSGCITGTSSGYGSINDILINLSSAPCIVTCYLSAENGFCTGPTNIFNITVNPSPVITVNSSTICAGETATLTANGATSYTWSAGATSTGVNTATVSPTVTTTYTVTGTNSYGCTNTAVATVTVNPVPTVTVNSLTICSGQTATLTANGATSYMWSGGATSTGLNIATASPTVTTTYTVTGTNTCGSNTAIATVTVNPTPATPPCFISGNNMQGCITYLTLTTNNVPGASYLWTGPFLNSTTGQTVYATATGAVGFCTCNYSVSITVNGCTSLAGTNTQYINGMPVLTNNPTNQTICSGGTISYSPLVIGCLSGAGASHTHSNNSCITGASTGFGNINDILINTGSIPCTITYTVTPTINNCDANPVSFTVTVNPAPTVLVNSPTICSGQTATLTANGATSFTWSAGATSTGVNTATVSPIVTTSYTVTGTNTCGSNTAVAMVTVNPIPTVTVNSDTICSGEIASLIANGATTYSWSAGATSTGVNTANVSPTSNATYTVTGTSNGCSNTAASSVTVNPAPTVTVNSPSICFGQSAILIASGANSYTWSVGATPLNNDSAMASPNSTTTYTVTGTGINGCINNAIAAVTVNPTYSSTASASICQGDTYTFPDNTTATSATVHTSYISSVHSCDSTIVTTLTINPAFSSTVSASICQGDTYTFPDNTTATSATVHTSHLSSVNTCDSSIVTTLTIYPAYTSILHDSICAGQTYSWNGQHYTSPGVYTANNTTINGCDSVLTLNLSLNTINSNIIVSGDTLTATQSGAIYQWLDCEIGNLPIAGATNQSYIVTTNGQYALAINLGGCTDTSACVLFYSVGLNNRNTANTISISPNPFTSTTTITFSEEQKNTTVLISDILGNTIQQLTTNNQQLILDMSSLAKGIYFLQINNDKGTVNKKLIKQ